MAQYRLVRPFGPAHDTRFEVAFHSDTLQHARDYAQARANLDQRDVTLIYGANAPETREPFTAGAATVSGITAVTP